MQVPLIRRRGSMESVATATNGTRGKLWQARPQQDQQLRSKQVWQNLKCTFFTKSGQYEEVGGVFCFDALVLHFILHVPHKTEFFVRWLLSQASPTTQKRCVFAPAAKRNLQFYINTRLSIILNVRIAIVTEKSASHSTRVKTALRAATNSASRHHKSQCFFFFF